MINFSLLFGYVCGLTWVVKVKINDETVDCEVDTGCPGTILNANVGKEVAQKANCKVKMSDMKLKSYTGHALEIVVSVAGTLKYVTA